MVRTEFKIVTDFISGTGSLVSGYTEVPFYEEGANDSLDNPYYSEYPHYRSGGNWTLDKRSHELTPASVSKYNASFTSVLYQGEAMTRHYCPVESPVIASSDFMDANGATAMSKVLPTNPSSDLLLGLAEIYREGLPSMIGASGWKNRSSVARAAGSEYLNYEFGWAPLVADIKAMAKATKDAEAILSRYLTDSGKVIRRRYDFPEINTTQLFDGSGFGYPTQAAIGWSGTTVKHRTTNMWFDGAFMYHIPMGTGTIPTFRRNLAMMDKLYGVKLDPELLWNLAPWSWAVDWFTNTGDVISNLSDWSKDGLVMRYGYVMEHTISKTTTTQTTNRLKQPAVVSPTIIVDETKKRRRANPFGFGLTWEGLTPRQLTIAAALGISKS